MMRIGSPRTTFAAFLLALVACGGGTNTDTDRALREARDAIAATLPADYIEDLTIESVAVEGDALVQLIRSPEGNAAKTRGHPRFDELRQAEQDDIHLLCALPAIQSLAATEARLVRRFVDREGNPFFEVELPARACAPASQ